MWNAECAHPIALPNGDDLARDCGVEVEVLVGVDMIKRQAGLLIGAELSLDLRLELRPHGGSRADIKSKLREVGAQLSPRVHEIGNARWRQRWPSLDKDQMQPHSQVR